MKDFMKKINMNAEYIQLCPTRARRSKEEIKNRHTNQIRENGLTGEALIDFIVDFVGKKRFKEEEYDALLIEDDKDDRFLSVQSDGTAVHDHDAWTGFKTRVKNRLKELCPEMPVIFFYAAPEVETWFLADFEHSFGNVYVSSNQLSREQNQYFVTKFRKHIKKWILTEKYQNCIEQYGYFGGTYRKLSEEIQNALNEIDFLEDYTAESKRMIIRYSKKIQGEAMLRQIKPETVESHCNVYFREGFLALHNLDNNPIQ